MARLEQEIFLLPIRLNDAAGRIVGVVVAVAAAAWHVHDDGVIAEWVKLILPLRDGELDWYHKPKWMKNAWNVDDCNVDMISLLAVLVVLLSIQTSISWE
jgi:hypothetical protein